MEEWNSILPFYTANPATRLSEQRVFARENCEVEDHGKRTREFERVSSAIREKAAAA